MEPSLIHKPTLELPKDENNRKKVLVAAGAVVVVAVGLYLVFKKDGGLPLPAIFESEPKEETFAGVISTSDGVGFEVVGAEDSKKYFAVSAETIFHTVDLSQNPPQKSPIVFSQVKGGENTVVVYVTKNKIDTALRVELPLLPHPPTDVKIDKNLPPPGSSNPPSSKLDSKPLAFVPVAQAFHLNGPSSQWDVSISASGSGSGESPNGSIRVDTGLSSNYTNYYWGMWLYGQLGSSNTQSTWIMGYGTGKNASFNFSGLTTGNYTTGGDAQMWWWNGSNWVYWTTLSAVGNTINIPSPPPPPPPPPQEEGWAQVTARTSDGSVYDQEAIIDPGQSATILWNTNGAQVCSIFDCPTGSDTSNPYSCNTVRLPSGSGSTGVLSTGPRNYVSACSPSGGFSGVVPDSVTVKVRTKCSAASQNIYTNINTTFTGTGGSGTYSWSGGGSPGSGSGSTFTTKFNSTGTKTVTVTSDGMPASCSVDVYNAPTVDLKVNGSNQDANLTTGQSATLSWTVSNATYCTATGAWAGSKSVISDSSESTGTYTSAGAYGYGLYCGNPAGSAYDNVSVHVTQPPPEILYLRSDKGVISTMAPNDTATITWDSRNATSCTLTSDNSTVPNYTGTIGSKQIQLLKTTKFTLTCSGTVSPNAVSSLTVQVSKIPSLTVSCSGSPTSASTGQNITWSSSWSGGLAPYTYKWASDSGSTNTSNVSASKTIAYTSTGSKSESMVVTSADGQDVNKPCGSVTISYPSITGSCKANKDTAFLNENVTWSSSSITGGDGSYTYSWIGTNGLSCSGQPSSSCASATKAYSTSGDKSATLTVTSAGASQNFQCRNFSDSSSSVAVNTPPITGSCSADKTTATVGESVAWRANNIGGGNGTYTYSWSGTSGLSCSGQPSASCNSVSKTYSSSGDKSATLTVDSGGVSNNFSCTNSSGGSKVAVYEPTLTVNSSSNSVQADGGTLQLQAVYDPDGSGPRTTTDVTNSASWSSDDTDKAIINNTNQKGLVTGGEETGNVKITVAYTDAYSNNLSANKTLSVTTRPVVTCSPATQNVFTNQAANFTAGGGNDTYTWTASGGNPSSGGSANFSTSYSFGGAKTVTVRSGSQNANCAVSVTAPSLSVTLSATPSSGGPPLAQVIVRADVASNQTGTTNYNFWWNCDSSATTYSGASADCGGALDAPAWGTCRETSGRGIKCDGINADYKEINHTYAAEGTYRTKVIVEKGVAPSAEKRTTVTVAIPPNSAPTATPLPPQAPGNYCANPFGWTLSWTFSDAEGNAQAAYQIIIKDASTGSTVLDTTRVNSSSTSYAIPLGYLSFGKTYSWTVTVTDNHQYNPLWSTANGANFSAIAHAAPAVSFNWTPSRPSRDEQVTFTDTTVASGGATKTTWQWSFPADATLLTGTNGSQASVKFITSGSKVVRLTVTDSDGLQCARSTGEGGIPSLNTGRGIPQFRETVPR